MRVLDLFSGIGGFLARLLTSRYDHHRLLRNQKELQMSLYTYKCWIERIVDGDTLIAVIDLGFHTKVTKSVRLSGYNAPEVLRAKTADERAFGGDAKALLQKLSSELQEWYIKTELDRGDKYGRILGEISSSLEAGVVSLNEVMRTEVDKVWAQLVEKHPDVYGAGW